MHKSDPESDALKLDAMAEMLARHVRPKTVRTAQEAILLGTKLLMVKEAAAEGRWRVYINAAGISAQTAERLIACARRFRDAPPLFFDMVGSASNLIELLALRGSDLQALMQGQDVFGLTLSGIGSVTKAQLRAAIGQAREADGQHWRPSPKRSRLPLTVREEHMLRLFRQCGPKGREALISMAGVLVEA